MQTADSSMDHLLDSRFHVEDYIAMGRSQEPEGSITQFGFNVLDVDLGKPAKTCKLLLLQPPRQGVC